ncbi:aminopeptidase N [Chryseobacterium gallinarum]|uniref:Aminopeptidase N n=1 Tax=Chryseobacterium gallinarum TaxID=1324352 RepID=A0A0G3M929_CHRGL|nr:M1 family aminopeptidase [Chryseobacterium gallinarum]AKK73517.1 aminopeptidase N [Chryseobacterium gallinarum]
MNTIFLFEAGRHIKHRSGYLIALALTGIGIFCGSRFNLTVGEGIFLNSPYTIGFMTGLLSISLIFPGVIYALQLLFKEADSRFDLLMFSFPVDKKSYLTGKFCSYYVQLFLSFFFLMTGFMTGQAMRTGSEMQDGFQVVYYLYPLLVFGLFNTFFISSLLFFVSFIIRKKLLVVVTGLFLYVLYMVVLLFSNSPFMAGSMPQSLEAQQLSAWLDPFGISSYFMDAKVFSVHQKNTQIVPFTHYLLFNRLMFSGISVIFLLLSFRLFSFSHISKRKIKKEPQRYSSPVISSEEYKVAFPIFNRKSSVQAILSFAKTDLIYLFKTVTIPAVTILLLFFIGMEMYAEIEKGIRLPQKYASSGLMATTISENFHILGILVVVYFLNDLYWRSHSSGFFLIEKSTFFSKAKWAGHCISMSILLFFFTGISIIEGIVFQTVYGYGHLDWNAYLGVFIFNTFPLILFTSLILLINDLIKNKFIALGISVVSSFVFAGPASQMLFSYPLLRIFSDFRGSYSDFNGYGTYEEAFLQRLLFGVGIMAVLWLAVLFIKTKKLSVIQYSVCFLLLFSGIYSGSLFMKGYIPKNEESSVLHAAQYEKKFRQYEHLPQPDITGVTTEIKLYPSENTYEITGKYLLKNQTESPVSKILINFNKDLRLKSAIFKYGSEIIPIAENTAEISLNQPMAPETEAVLDFELSYQWFAVNGHQSFNAIIENGSFARISRYYPGIGYQKGEEIQDEQKRKEYRLGKLEPLQSPENPAVFKKDFITLDMTLSTEGNQTAVGTGDLIKSWSTAGRNYSRYYAKNIPFRFAFSSAVYQIQKVNYKGILINILYHKNHGENVEHLIQNAKLTLDYCQQNFGQYPFSTITFAEISSFTRGFAATAYPSVIFMPEDMIFHANIHADKEQDVINELAGHELSHLWWGNSQIDPDHREGSVMLTETLAMYTEMMLYKKMHGKEKMTDRIRVHQQIYDNEKGLSENVPIYRATGKVPHISYSKGAVAMVKLSELIGEEKVNLALRNFLSNNRYPKKPGSLDLLKEFYHVSPPGMRPQIDGLFKVIENTAPSYSLKGPSVKEKINDPIGSF